MLSKCLCKGCASGPLPSTSPEHVLSSFGSREHLQFARSEALSPLLESRSLKHRMRGCVIRAINASN